MLVVLVYAEVKKLPTEEWYALGDQIRRVVASMPSNITEGNGQAMYKDYTNFLSIAHDARCADDL